jgi:hypothetical protein
MKKTLLEHHYEIRIESLRDDPSVNYDKRLVAIQLIAKEHNLAELYRTQGQFAQTESLCNPINKLASELF